MKREDVLKFENDIYELKSQNKEECITVIYYAVQALLNVIPKWVSNGLQITMGLLPAIGFGLLLMMIMEKEVACFFILGFAMSVYLGVPVTGIAIFGAIIAIVLTQLRSKTTQPIQEGGLDEDDDF